MKEPFQTPTHSLEVFGGAIHDQILALAYERTKPGSTDPVRVSVEFEIRWVPPMLPKFEITTDLDLCWMICSTNSGGKGFNKCYAACKMPINLERPVIRTECDNLWAQYWAAPAGSALRIMLLGQLLVNGCVTLQLANQIFEVVGESGPTETP